MRLLNWIQDYATGIDLIDSDHRRLIGKINVLHEELDAGGRTVPSFFRALEAEFKRQFQKEEASMRSHASASYGDHKHDHARLLDEIRDIAEAFGNAEEIDSVDLALRLDAWLSRHFIKHDSQLPDAAAAAGRGCCNAITTCSKIAAVLIAAAEMADEESF